MDDAPCYCAGYPKMSSGVTTAACALPPGPSGSSGTFASDAEARGNSNDTASIDPLLKMFADEEPAELASLRSGRDAAPSFGSPPRRSTAVDTADFELRALCRINQLKAISASQERQIATLTVRELPSLKSGTQR